MSRRLLLVWSLPLLSLAAAPPGSGSAVCVERPLKAVAPCATEGREAAKAPGINRQIAVASATRSPWLDTNAALFRRNPNGVFFYQTPAEKSALALAEAWVYGVKAAVVPKGESPRLSAVREFLASLDQTRLSPLADFTFVDDGSPQAAEVMNLLARRNLLFERVTDKPGSGRKVLQIGSSEFPKSLAANPSEFAYAVRRWLTDEQRSLRIYGTENVIAYATADKSRVRIYLLNYSGAPVEGIGLRVAGKFGAGTVQAFDAPGAKLIDWAQRENAAEFTVPLLNEIAVVELKR